MKFKSDGCGWRDLRIGDVDGDHLQISVDTQEDRLAFIAVSKKDGTYNAHDLSRKQLLRLAFNIIKELSK